VTNRYRKPSNKGGWRLLLIENNPNKMIIDLREGNKKEFALIAQMLFEVSKTLPDASSLVIKRKPKIRIKRG
jgi:hypothetical protein